jgi:hypothetical protein
MKPEKVEGAQGFQGAVEGGFALVALRVRGQMA